MADESRKVARDKVVSIAFKLFDDDGELIDEVPLDDPVVFLQGAGEIIPGLENNLYGMAVGEKKKIVVQPDDAYGDVDPDAFDVIDLDLFPEDLELEEGLDIELTDPETGETIDAWVQEVRYDDDEVLVSFNHPFAGMTLNFQVTVVDVRDATPEELAHGHAHEDDDEE